VNVVILPDTAVEGEESFLVTLTNPQGGAILSSNVVSATVVIDDANDDPPNDTFAKATSLTGLSGDLLNATNAGSSVEPGEPATPGGHTIWFSWTAPTSGLATFSTAGSGTVAQPLDTILTVFTGSALSSLKVVTQNDNASPIDLTSRVSFAATGGTVYRLAVDARAPLVGLTQLHWSLATAGSCSFAATRYPVNEGAGSVVINVQRSGVNVNPATVKYQTIDGTAIAGSDYTATSGTLQFAAGQTAKTFSVPITDDNVNKGERTFQVQLALDNGTFPAAIVEPSTATVRIFDNDGNPLYDSFAGAIDLTGSPTGPWTNVGATVEPGEALLQSVVGKLGGGRTIWFKWTASTNGIATIDTVGSTGTNGPLDTVLAVFYGTALNNLTLVADNDEAPGDSQISSVQFQAKSGRTYFIAVDTVGDATGSIVVNTDLEAPDGDGPLLLATPTFTPTLTFKESYSSRDDLDPPGKGSFSATIVSPLDQVDLAGLNASTIFSVAIGGFEYDGTLGAGTFSSGSTRTYTLPSGATVKLAWTAKQLTVTISSTLNSTFTGEFPFPDPSYDTGKIQDSAAATIEFGGVTGARTVFAYGSASNRTTAAGVTFTTVALSGSADYKPPTVTITTPKANMVYKVDPLNPGTVPSITLTGAATDDVEVTDVEVRVNGGDFNPVTAFTPGGVNQDDVKHVTWEYDGLDLAPGLNFIEVTATDSSGTVTTTSRTVNFQTMSTITLIVDGQGTITPSFQGTSLELGKVYTITAKPSAGWIFKGWTGGVSATDLKLTFTMQDGLIVHAVFIANPYTSLQGVFNGLARPGTFDPTKTGTFTLTLAAAGSFSGKLALGSVAAISFTGSFDDKGNAVVVIPRKGQASLTLRLSADLLNGTEQITGTVSDGTFTSAIVSDRVTFDAKTNPAPQFGRYSIILSSNPALTGLAIPFGHGFLTAVVNSSGGVSLNGRLPDDTMISFSSQLSKAGVLPIYETLPNSSPLSGSALFGPARPGTASGSVDWVRGSTAVSLGFRGESYDFAKGGHVLPKLSFNGPLPTLPTSLAGGGYPTETTKTVTITTDNKAIVTATVLGLQNFTISTADGTFTADVAKLGGGKVLKLKGILLQGSTLGAGYFLNGAASGHFIIGTP
jgi:hypothetical protein